MFTGIIEATGKVVKLERESENLHLTLSCPFTSELKPDQSVAHNGVCLTVTEISANEYQVTAVKETLDRTNLALLNPGDFVNLERCMKLQDRIDGHIVQGHVDTQAEVLSLTEDGGSWKIQFQYPAIYAALLVDKGSVCINGISLTVIHPDRTTFSVAIIPYTWEHTNLHTLKPGNKVNIEFDILGKYVQRLQQVK